MKSANLCATSGFLLAQRTAERSSLGENFTERFALVFPPGHGAQAKVGAELPDWWLVRGGKGLLDCVSFDAPGSEALGELQGGGRDFALSRGRIEHEREQFALFGGQFKRAAHSAPPCQRAKERAMFRPLARSLAFAVSACSGFPGPEPRLLFGGPRSQGPS
jgi:hypothetical protein